MIACKDTISPALAPKTYNTKIDYGFIPATFAAESWTDAKVQLLMAQTPEKKVPIMPVYIKY